MYNNFANHISFTLLLLVNLDINFASNVNLKQLS